MSKVEPLGLDWAARSLDGDQWIQFLEEDVRQHPQSALEWERHRSRGQGQDAPVARDTAGFSDPPPSILQGVAAAGQTAGTVPAFRQGAQMGQALLQAAVQPEPTEPGLFKAAVLPDDGSPHLLTKVADDEGALAALRGQQPPPVAPAVEQAPGEGGLKTIALQPDPMRKAAVELDMPSEFMATQHTQHNPHDHLTALIKAARTSTSMREGIEAGVRSAQPEPDFKQAMGAIVEAVRVACKVDIQAAVWAGMLSGQVQTEPMRKAAVELNLTTELLAPKPVDDAAPAAMRASKVAAPAAPTEPQDAGNGLKTLAPRPPEVLLKPAVQPEGGEMIQATQAEVREARAEVVLVNEQPTMPPAPAAVPAAPAAPAAAAPVAAPTPAPPAATPAPTPAAAAPADLTPAQVDALKGAWAAVGTDPYQVLKWMDEYGLNAAQFAQAVGTSEQSVADALTLMGVPQGYGGALTVGREQLNADFEAQLQAALQSSGGKIDLQAFVREYLSRDTAASRQFARLHGAMQFNRQTSTPDQFDEGALVVKGQPGMQTVTFGTGYTIRVGEGAAMVRLTQWDANPQVQQHVAIPKASQAERQAMLADLGKQNEKLLQAYGGNETLPDNEVTRLLRIKYGEAVATLMYRVDKAMERARNDYIGGLQEAMAAGSGRGWVERTKTVVDESGPHEVKTQEFDVRAFHAAITGGTDPKAQVLKELFGELQEHNGEFTIRGQGGVQHFSVSYSESGQPSLQVGAQEVPEGTRKIDLANPPKLKDPTAVGYIPGVGFVTEISNIIPPPKKKKKWKMAVAIVACVAVAAFTAGTAAPALCQAMGIATTGAAATTASIAAAGAITGAMTAAATTITTGLIVNGKVDSKALLKGMVAGAITGAVFGPPPTTGTAPGSGSGLGSSVGAGASTGASMGTTATSLLTNSLPNRMLVQGLISKAQGGKFISGAMSAAAADVGKFVDAKVADALKNSVLGSVAGELGKAAGSLAKAGVSSGGHGGERFWGSVANDIGELARPYVTPNPNGRPRSDDTQRSGTEPRPMPQIDPLEQASPPPDLYGDHDQWASDNQQALEDMRAQQKAQEEARSAAQSAFRQSELEAQQQQRPFLLTPPEFQADIDGWKAMGLTDESVRRMPLPDLDNWDLSGATPASGPVDTTVNGADLASDQAHAANGDVPVRTEAQWVVGKHDALEKIARAQYGENWRAGMVAMAQENKLRLDANGSPIITPGQTLRAPDISGMSEANLARDNRAGGRMIESNTAGLARAQQERAQRTAAVASGAGIGADAGLSRGVGPAESGRSTAVATDPFAFLRPAANLAAPGVQERLSGDAWRRPSLSDSLSDIANNDALSFSQKLDKSVNKIDQAVDDWRQDVQAQGAKEGPAMKALTRSVSQLSGLVQGTALGTYRLAEGLSALGSGAMNLMFPATSLLNSPQDRTRSVEQALNVAETVGAVASPGSWLTDPAGTLDKAGRLASGLVEPFRASFEKGDYPKLAGQLVPEVGGLFFGGEMPALSRLGRAAGTVDDLAAAGRLGNVEGTSLSPLQRSEITAPNGRVITVVSQDSAIVPVDKVEVYARGGSPNVSQELSDLQAFKQQDRKTFDLDPANQARIDQLKKMQHNFERSQAMAQNLDSIGLPNTLENNDLIMRNLLETGQSVTPVNRVWVPGTLTGPSGSLRVNSTWSILPDGTSYLSTLRFMPIGD